MVYLEIRDRTGNQMFQYAFARYLTIKYNDELSINFNEILRKYDEENGWRNSLADFNVCKHRINVKNNKYSVVQKLLLAFMQKYLHHNDPLTVYRKQKKFAPILSKFGIFFLMDGYFKFNDPYKFIRHKIVIGYFESPRYFSEIDDLIKKEFTPRYPLLARNTELYKTITSSDSVCIAIRRGDFLSAENKDNVFICKEQYYYKAVEIIKKQFPDAVLFVFSDDIEWVKETMKFPGKVYYESGKDPVWETLRLMSACKHFIMSNSTFSWWAQHLSTNENKIVIAPKRWRKDGRTVDIYEDNWTLLDV